MKVLYISRLEGHNWQGPTYSVPMQIKYQAEIDDVLWVNMCSSIHNNWKKFAYYQEVREWSQVRFKNLPETFRAPDIVVFEGVYEYPFAKIIFEIWNRNIPYVIVPRSALTADAQKKKPLKKMIGNICFFNKFVHKASAIHYLTQSEQADSQKWKTNSFVIPNGILPVKNVKMNFAERGQLVFSYVGRIERFQKGLDMLILACDKISKELRDAHVSVHLYGPDREDSFANLTEEIRKYNLSDIIFLHEGVFGEEKERVLLESDAFIMTSRFEGLPMGMIEALAYGVPVMATKGTNLTKEIKDADAGWISDNTVDGIVKMLRYAILDRSEYKIKSRNALALSKKYNWEEIAKKTHIEYYKLLNKTN